MEEGYQDPVPLAKGINLSDIMSSAVEFHIDMDFKNKKRTDIHNDLFSDNEEDTDSETEDVLKNIEKTTDEKLLSSPEYHSFSELQTKMVDCVASGDVKMLIVEEGDGPLVPLDAEVTIHYAAYWEKAKIPFDSTLTMNRGEPICIRLGAGRVLPGIEIGLQAIHGPTARLLLLLQPIAAWGPRGAPPRIRPQPALFVITLYSVTDIQASIRFNDLPREEQSKYETTLKTVNSLHSQAKLQFSKSRYGKCIKHYQQSISVLNLSRPTKSEENDVIIQLKINAFLNLAVCYYKINKPKYILRMLESLEFLTDVDKCCKALFYKGRANELLGHMDRALDFYNAALKIEPRNKDIGKALDNLDKYMKNSAEREKTMWKTVFKTKTEDVHKVSEDFHTEAKDMLVSLSESDEYCKLDLPRSLTKSEIDYMKKIAGGLNGVMILEENGRFSVIRTVV